MAGRRPIEDIGNGLRTLRFWGGDSENWRKTATMLALLAMTMVTEMSSMRTTIQETIQEASMVTNMGVNMAHSFLNLRTRRRFSYNTVWKFRRGHGVRVCGANFLFCNDE